MKLRDLVIRQQVTGEKDSELVTEWILSNSDVTEYITILSELATKKIKHDEFVCREIVLDIESYSATRSLIETYGIDNGIKLDRIIKKWIMYTHLGKDFEQSYPECMVWLKEFIPENKLSSMFWYDFLVYLNSKGIYFKDQKK